MNRQFDKLPSSIVLFFVFHFNVFYPFVFADQHMYFTMFNHDIQCSFIHIIDHMREYYLEHVLLSDVLVIFTWLYHIIKLLSDFCSNIQTMWQYCYLWVSFLVFDGSIILTFSSLSWQRLTPAKIQRETPNMCKHQYYH